ncbi:MAG: hypothetical protein ACIAXF_04890 [Phycisphaerales bacterium JB063]
MADVSAPRVLLDPPLRDWRLSGSARPADRAELAPLLDTPGPDRTPFDPTRPIIATGHQAWFWHPGILAKDIAMSVACERFDAQPVHLVVDHIDNSALSIDVPVRLGDAIDVKTLRLGSEDLALGTGQRPPLKRGALADAVDAFERGLDGEPMVDLSALREADALAEHAAADSLADSITAMQLAWMRPTCGEMFVLRTSQLARLASFQSLVDRMLREARRCVSAYNAAVARVPEAGVAPLLVERDRVELPLWVMASAGRGRVFADLADRVPLLTHEDGTPIGQTMTDEGGVFETLAPKALTLTAFMRSTLCDLFIHGKGGGVYEQVTEHWWRAWFGETLAPLAVVSADVYLDFALPTATPDQLERAVWYRHHLPYNIDREVDDADTLDKSRLAEKHGILAGSGGTYTKREKRAARRRLRAINRAFAEQNAGLVADAQADVERARRGVANADIANRRDWCFAFYPPEQLAKLRESIVDSA